jgi:hypothetical protein
MQTTHLIANPAIFVDLSLLRDFGRQGTAGVKFGGKSFGSGYNRFADRFGNGFEHTEKCPGG